MIPENDHFLLKQYLYLPTFLISLSNGKGFECCIVCKKIKFLTSFWISIMHNACLDLHSFFLMRVTKDYFSIRDHSFGNLILVQWSLMRLCPLCTGFQKSNEPNLIPGQPVVLLIINIAFIKS